MRIKEERGSQSGTQILLNFLSLIGLLSNAFANAPAQPPIATTLQVADFASTCESCLLQICKIQTQNTCQDITGQSGVYTLNYGGGSEDVYCDMQTDGGGWTTFYRRQDGSMNVGYTNVVTGINEPDDSEFVVDIAKLKSILDQIGGPVSLLIEMKEEREHAFALYQDFRIIEQVSSYYLRVEQYDEGSTAGNSLTLSPNIQANCNSIFVKNYYQTRCHPSSPFGNYNSNTRYYGVHWPSWLGDAISLDYVEMKFKKWHCNVNTGAKCHLCDNNYALVIDPVSGREYCQLNTVTSTCFLNKIKNFSLDNCIDAEDCKVTTTQYISDLGCLSCHSSCYGGCKGPEREDCLFGTCREYHQFFPEHADDSHLAILLINGELKPTWCEPEGWTLILNNKDNDNVSSLDFMDFVTQGVDYLPRMFMMPLNNIAAMTSQKNYELRVELSHTDGSTSFDHYGYFALTTNTFKFNAHFKKASSANLGSFDAGSLLNEVDFQAAGASANPTPCFSNNNSGSWYTASCDGFVLLGDNTNMYYGALAQIEETKMLIRETGCEQWESQNGSTYRCSECRAGYVLNALQECIKCPGTQSCDITSCTDQSVFLQDSTFTSSCFLDSFCRLEDFPAANCTIPTTTSPVDPSQISEGTVVEEEVIGSPQINQVGQAVQTATGAAVASSIGFSMATNMSLNNLWTLLSAMQLVSLLKYINAQDMPQNFIAFIKYLDVTMGNAPAMKKIPNFFRLLFPMEYGLYNETLSFTNPFTYDSHFASHSFILNFELKLSMALYVALLLSIVIFLRYLCGDHPKWVKCWRRFYSDFFFWRVVTVIYLELTFLLFFGVTEIQHFSSTPQVFNSILSVLSLLFVTLFPVFLLVCLLKHRLFASENQDWKGRTATNTLNLQSRLRIRVLAPFTYFLERYLYCLVLIFLTERPTSQLILCVVLFFLMLVYVIVARPYRSKVKFILSIFNYLCMLALMSLMLLFQTGLQKSSKDTFGSIMTFLLISNFMINMLVMIVLMSIQMVKKFRQCCKKKKKKGSMEKSTHSRIKVEPSSGSEMSFSLKLDLPQNASTSLEIHRLEGSLDAHKRRKELYNGQFI